MSDKFGYRISQDTNVRMGKGPELPDYLKGKRTPVKNPGVVHKTNAVQSRSASSNPAQSQARKAATKTTGRQGGSSGGSRGGGSRNGGGGGSEKRPRKKKNNAKALLVGAGSTLCLMLGVLVFVLLSAPPSQNGPSSRDNGMDGEGANTQKADSGKFFEGVTVDGVDVGNQTYAQAKNKVGAVAERTLDSIRYSLELDGKEFTITKNDIKAQIDYEAVLHEAFNVGREGSVLENIDEQSKAKSGGVSFATELTYDEASLRARLEEIANEAYIAPIEPRAVVNKEGGDRFKYEPGKSGKKANVDEAAAAIQRWLEAGEYSAALNIPTSDVAPKHTVDDVKANTKKIDSALTYFKSSAGRKPERVYNIEKAAGILSGAELKPGQEWSFNEFVGPRTLKGGWKEAPGIVNGNMYEMQAGGGICQISTTLYNACLKSDLEIVSSKRHSWPSSYVEYGLDATVSTGGPDLVIKNNKDYSIFIFASVDTKEYSVTISVYGPNTLGEGVKVELHSKVIDEQIPPEPDVIEDPRQPVGYKETTIEARPGYTCEVYRNLVKDGSIIKTEMLYTHKYRAVKGEMRVGTSSKKELDPVPPNPESSAAPGATEVSNQS